MLTKEKRNNFRLIKYVAVAVALVALAVLCLTSCGKALPTSVEVVANPEKTDYVLNEVFDCTGAKIKVTYDNGSTEEFDVTVGMITPTLFDSTDIKSVTVTYAENGVSVMTTITVKVTDQFATERAAALAALATVKTANPADLGIAALIDQYTKSINTAASADLIASLAAQFEDDAEAFLAAKADLLDELAGLIAKVEAARTAARKEEAKAAAIAKAAAEGKSEAEQAAAGQAAADAVVASKLYAQYLTGANNEIQKATTAINAAASVSAAEKALADCEYALNTLLETQEVYEKEDGLNAQKLALLKEIVTYKERGNLLISYVDEVLNDVNTADAVKATLRAQIQKYNTAIDTLNDAYNAVLLALDLSQIQALIDEALEELRTPIDDIYDALKGGIEEIVPAPFFEDKVNNAWTLNTDADAVGALLAEILGYYNKAVELFGETRTVEMMEAYKFIDEDGKTAYVDLKADWTGIKATYDTLVAWQNAAIADVIGKLDAAIASKADADIAAAWDALKAWGNGKVFTFDDAAIILASKLGFDLDCADGTYTFSAIFGDYALTEAHMITYFVPNFFDFEDAVAESEADKVEDAVEAIGQVIYSLDATLDSDAAIKAARKAITDYIANYGEDYYETYCYVNGTDELDAIVTAKEEEYAARKALANSIIADVKASVAAKDIAAIVIEDYTNDGSVLANAYANYIAFLGLNTLEEARGTFAAGTVVIDVLQVSALYTGSAADDKVDAQLIARIKAYITQAVNDEMTMKIADTINAAFSAKLGTYNPETESVQRTALKEYYIAQVAAMNAYVVDFSGINTYATNLVKVGEATTSVLDTNVAAVDALATQLAGNITNWTYVHFQ